jgi:hypothetical protein
MPPAGLSGRNNTINFLAGINKPTYPATPHIRVTKFYAVAHTAFEEIVR